MSLTPEFFDATRGQKILFIEPFYWTPHVETGLELAEILSRDNDVTYAGPDVLRCATDETVKLHARIRLALTRKRNVSRYAGPKVRTYSRTEIASIERGLDLPTEPLFDPLSNHLQGVTFETFDVGMGVTSSLISLTRDVHFDRAAYSDVAAALGRDSVKLYRLTQELIRANAADIVFLFNGRVAACRGIRRACESMGVRYIVHERGSSADKYALFDCATPHQPGAMRRWVDDWWRIADQPEAGGREFLARRRHKISTDWYSFTGRQQLGHFPPRDTRRRVTFFTSSDDELVAMGDELPADSPYCDQIYAIRALGQACRERGHEFVVRFHPNTPSTAHDLMAAAREATPAVLDPSSQVDTYALVDSSDVVLVQSSTVGMEAAANGKPVYYTGRNFWEQCTSVRRIMDAGDVSAALETTKPPDPTDAVRYAYFFGHHGIRYRYFRPRGFLSGTYRGRDLNSPLSTLRDMKLRISRGGT